MFLNEFRGTYNLSKDIGVFLGQTVSSIGKYGRTWVTFDGTRTDLGNNWDDAKAMASMGGSQKFGKVLDLVFQSIDDISFGKKSWGVGSHFIMRVFDADIKAVESQLGPFQDSISEDRTLVEIRAMQGLGKPCFSFSLG